MSKRRTLPPAPGVHSHPDGLVSANPHPTQGLAIQRLQALCYKFMMSENISNPRHTIQQLLQQSPLLRGLDTSEMDSLTRGTRKVALARGETLFRPGDTCAGFYLVVYGRIKLLHSAQPGAERVIRLISPGRSFGEAAMYLERPYMMTAETVEDTLLLHIDRAHLFLQLAHSPALARRLLQGLSWQLYMMFGDVGAYTMRSGTQRLVGYLLREHERTQSPTLTLDVSKRTLASRLNLTPERFSRILHELADKGLIAVDDRSFTLIDLEGLKREH